MLLFVTFCFGLIGFADDLAKVKKYTTTGVPGRLRLALGLLLGLGAAALLGERAYLALKAELAQVLLDRAFERRLAGEPNARPWRWADMQPVAELEVPRLNLRRSILSGASGESLAFGLGHLHGTALPGQPGRSVVAGHRDSFAAFLQRLRPGDDLWLRVPAGRQRYRVLETQVVHRSDTGILRDQGEGLTLLTCWPFEGLLRSPWRYVVRAEPLGPGPQVVRREVRSRSTASLAPSSRG